jgi:hypothetical protein
MAGNTVRRIRITGTLYDQAMSNLVVNYNSDVVQSFSFASVRKLIDVGGGDGSLLIELLRANPAMRGVLLDLPHVAKAAHERISNAGLSDRCEIAPGDAMESVPSGADTFVISRVVHNWADTEAIRLLANCKKALPLDRYSGRSGDFVLVLQCCHAALRPTASTSASRSSMTRW